jgi:ABC-type enterochelin transport system permease subunit
MDHLFTKLLVHICNQETNEAVDMAKANLILITMEDNKLHLSPLQHALFNQAPFNIISTFMSHWLLLEDLHSLAEMQLVHLACGHNATFDIIHYLSSFFPASLTMRDYKEYTPFMLTLYNKLNEDIIYLLDAVILIAALVTQKTQLSKNVLKMISNALIPK